jgi:hypothetical protein
MGITVRFEKIARLAKAAAEPGAFQAPFPEGFRPSPAI